jgi:hypothetical protein
MKNFLIICLLLLVSCKTYTIEPSSLKAQLLMTELLPHSVYGDYEGGAYLGRNIKELKVLNSKNETVILNIQDPIRLKITAKNGHEDTCYLRSMAFAHDSISGMGPTYFVGGMIYNVHIDSIASIKVKP